MVKKNIAAGNIKNIQDIIGLTETKYYIWETIINLGLCLIS